MILTAMLLVFALSHGASARDPFGRSVRRPVERAAEPLRIADERRNARASLRLLEMRRDAERRAVEPALRREGTSSQVRAYRARVEAVEAADDLRVRQRLVQRAPEWWSQLGPHTRRVFENSEITLGRSRRRQELRGELAALEREVEQRERAATLHPLAARE